MFIDGVSLKSNLQQGGIVGQDVSRGNPFSQLAVQEFRVLTSNFKAEYEDAGTAIITAITKSGTNEFHGEVFGTFQNDNMISRDFLQKRNDDDVNLKRYQFGAALGGPIIKDKLFFFANYEGNIQDRALTVTPGAIPAGDNRCRSIRRTSPAPSTARSASISASASSTGRSTTGSRSKSAEASARKPTSATSAGKRHSPKRRDVNNDVYTGKLRHEYRRRRLPQ